MSDEPFHGVGAQRDDVPCRRSLGKPPASWAQNCQLGPRVHLHWLQHRSAVWS